METIGEKIRKLRRGQNLSQEMLAFELGVSRQTIHKWEIEAMQPNAENLKALSDYFNIDINYFFIDNDTPVFNETAATKNKTKSKKRLVCCSIITAFIFLIFLLALAFTIGTGIVAFSPNRGGFDYVVLLDAGIFTFLLFLLLSIIILALAITMIFYIKKCVV